MKSSFVLYTDNHSSIELLTVEQKAMLLDLFFLYHKDVDIDIKDPVLKMAFSFFERTFERDKIKYDKRVEANKNNGLKGGRPKNPDEPKKPTGLNENPNNPDEPKKADTVPDTVPVPVPVIKEKNLLSDSSESGQTKKQFKKPSIEEITIYCQERKNRVDPDKFFNFYESKGWMIGKNKMKNWRSAIITWEKGEDEKPGYRKNESNSLFNNNNGPEYAEL